MANLEPSRSSAEAGNSIRDAHAWAKLIGERDLTEVERKCFEAWLDDPKHEMAFVAAANLVFRLTEVPEKHREGRFLEAAASDHPRYLPKGRGWGVHIGVSAAAVVLAAVGVAWIVRSERHPHYSTQIAEQRTLNLPDGSRVELNTQTDLEWLGTRPCDRRIKLIRGEALFDVHVDPHCPFQVLVGRGGIEVLGTRFDVYQHKNGDDQVSVLEGRVRIHGLVMADGAPLWQMELAAGQEAVWNQGSPTIHTRDVDKLASWRNNQVDFSDQSLAEVVDELQRYSPIPLRIGDSRLLKIHVTGELQVSDIRAAVTRLAARPEMQVVDDGKSLTLKYRAGER